MYIYIQLVSGRLSLSTSLLPSLPPLLLDFEAETRRREAKRTRRTMGTQAEQITVPARFITMTAHFITVLTVLYDLVRMWLCHHYRDRKKEKMASVCASFDTDVEHSLVRSIYERERYGNSSLVLKWAVILCTYVLPIWSYLYECVRVIACMYGTHVLTYRMRYRDAAVARTHLPMTKSHRLRTSR